MADTESPTSRTRWWKRLLLTLAGTVLVAAVVLVLLPDLLPSAAVRSEVAALLSERLGRPVTVAAAHLDWRTGLTALNVRIGRRDGDGALANVERLAVLFAPTEAARAAAGSEPSLKSVRFDGLELWLVRDADGRWNVADLFDGKPLDVGMVQLAGARVHVLDGATDRRLDFENVHASVGELAETDNGYVSLSADLVRTDADAAPLAEGPLAVGGWRARSGPRAGTGASSGSEPADGASAPGHVMLTANLDRLEFGPDALPVGSLKAEWSDLPWDRLWAVLAPGSPVGRVLRGTSGRMSATLSEDTWSAEGSVHVAEPSWPVAGGEPADGEDRAPPLLPDARVGFRLSGGAASAPLAVETVTLSAAGLNLKVTGTVSPSPSPAPDGAGAPSDGTAADEAGAAARAWARPVLDLSATGSVTWVPLCRQSPVLEPFLERFDRLGGKADVHFAVTPGENGLELKGGADLNHTILVAPGRFEKPEPEPLDLTFSGKADRGFRTLSDAELKVETAGADLVAQGSAPLDGLLAAVMGRGDGTGVLDRLGGLAGAQGTATVEVRKIESVLALVPALKRRLGRLAATGPCRIEAAAKAPAPGESGGEAAPSAEAADAVAGPPGWVLALRANLTEAELDLEVPGGALKPAGTPARVDVDAVGWPDRRRSDVRRTVVRLGEGRIAWDGSARIDWPRKEDEQPVGRFAGDLTVETVEALGAILAPGRFADARPPVAGRVVFEDMEADLAKGRLRVGMEAGIDGMALRIGRYLVKPAGRAARLGLTTLWHTGRWNQVQGSIDLDLPGARLSAVGEAILVAEWEKRTAAAEDATPPADEAEDAVAAEDAAGRVSRPPAPGGGAAESAVVQEGYGAETGDGHRAETGEGRLPKNAAPADPPRTSVAVTLGPKSTVEIKASVSDLKEAASLSPLLADALRDDRADGGADGRLVLSLRRDGLQVSGQVDLTETALDLGRLLVKPAGRRLRARLAGDVAPHPRGWVEVRLAPAEVRLAESSTRLEGRIRLDWAGLTAAAEPSARLAAAVREVDVTAEGDWEHGPALHRMLPWLEPMRDRCRLNGTTRWNLAVAGSPTRGTMHLTLTADGCRISTVPGPAGSGKAVTVKEAGTPAGVDLEMAYGEVPGEVRLTRADLHLARAEAKAKGRLLFDDPWLLNPAAPAAWTVEMDARVPDAAVLPALLPWHLEDLAPTGGVVVAVRAAADAKGGEVESCHLRFDEARIRWLERAIRLDGVVDYSHDRLETDGLALKAGGSDVRIVTYIARPSEDPTGSLILRGRSLDVEELLEVIRRTSESLGRDEPPPAATGEAEDAEASEPAEPGGPGHHLRRLLARAHLSADVRLDRVSVVNPKWGTRYDLEGFEAEGRLADRHLVLPRFACRLNEGTATGRIRLDFREDPPLLVVAYDARDLAMAENLKPFIDTTFPGMQVFGTLSTRATRAQRLASGSRPVGKGETILTDGVLQGPAAPDYVTAILPGLKLTRYEFNLMSNVFEQRPDGVTENRMLFDGKAYDLFIFGHTYPDGRTEYTMGVDLLLSLGSDVSRTLDQGKLPLMHYNGRIVGKEFAERRISYVLPHELAYDVFLRRNLLLKLIRSLGRPEPDIRKPDVLPPEERRPEPRLAEPRKDEPAPKAKPAP